MTEREEFEKWFAENMESKIGKEMSFPIREAMWEGWQGKASSLDHKK